MMDKIRRNLKIKINQGEEYKIRLGCVYDADSLFYDSYQRGAEILRETLKNAEGITKRDISYAGTEDDDTYEFSNNIIAFCGGRGEGKSSAMRTFAHALECVHASKQYHSSPEVDKFWKIPMENHSFEILPVIDPTMMREQDSFMRVILSRMFSQVKKRCGFDPENERDRIVSGSHRDKPSNDQKERILTDFRDCYAYLDTLSKKPDPDNRYDDLEEIASLGDSGSLKSKFRHLVKEYLGIMDSDHYMERRYSYLVLQIDDADLNIGQAYSILEDIRSFCLVPEVIILMAMDMQQLQQIIEQHFIKDFELMLKYSDRGTSEEVPLYLQDCRCMAMRYIDKVVPGSRQIHLPQIDAVLKDEMFDLSVSYLIPDNMNRGNVTDALAKMDDISADYQECLLGWIYQKTGIALIRPGTYRHNLLPGHLRELAHFLAFFGKMADLDTEYNIARIHSLLRTSDEELTGIWKEKRKRAIKAKELWAGNLQGLEQYFIKNWVGLHLSREGQRIIQEIENTADTLKGQAICAFCDELACRFHVKDFSFRGTDYVRYSYAYVMARLNSLSSALKQEEDYCVVYALRFYYMILVYKKLLALTGDDAGYEQLLRDVKYESWIPDYSGMKKELVYGRFEVNLYALGRLRSEFDPEGDTDELLDRFKGMLYVITRSNMGRYIQKQDILKPAAGSKDRDRVMFDWSFFLMEIVLGKGGNYSLPPGDTSEEIQSWEIAVDRFDMALQFLFNWDVQHYLEWNLEQENNDKSDGVAKDLSAWFKEYWSELIELVRKQKYIMWMVTPAALSGDSAEFPIINITPKGFDVLYYGNHECVNHLLVDFYDELSEKVKLCEEDNVPETRKWTYLNEMISKIKRRQEELEGCALLTGVDELSKISLKQWGEAMKEDELDKNLDPEQREAVLGVCKRWVELLGKYANQSILEGIFNQRVTDTEF